MLFLDSNNDLINYHYLVTELFTLLFSCFDRMLDSILSINLSFQRLIYPKIKFYHFDLYCFLLFFSIISTFVTNKILNSLPEKYFEEKNIIISKGYCFIFYIFIGLFIVFLFNDLLAIILFFGFLNLVIPLFIIDLKTGYLPDILTYPLLWLGLLYQVWMPHGNVVSAIYAVILSFTMMVVITTLVEKIKKRPQMGRGDFKLIAACAAWLGILQLPYLLGLAAFLGLIQYGIGYLKLKNKQVVSIPFGPAIILSASLWLYLFNANNILI
ncbi:A24 family peptidase [Providencia sp.]|uniref:prepilin peptidase n=1 Tax=Providencia sp. TaxID=589 RepID=UPI0025F6D3E2|nr:A24 family peptidase [Providencia sp.]